MRLARGSLLTPRLVKFIAALVVGLSIGTAVPPRPVVLPVAGSVPGLVVGATGLVVGAALYRHGPTLVGQSGCDCSGACGCS